MLLISNIAHGAHLDACPSIEGGLESVVMVSLETVPMDYPEPFM